MDPVLRDLLLDRLEAGDLDEEAKRVLVAMADVGAPTPTATAPPVWLKAVTVEGFRGIGPAATLELEPAPGLTVVVGRNGSGKSSFAEGLELLMTGVLKRWEKRPKAWTETWQCLHHDEPTRISARLLLEGGEEVSLAQTWPHGAGYGDASGRAEPAKVLAKYGWDRDLPSFRPFLAYAELATMFDTLSSLYDALTPVLGLADLDTLAQNLAAARLQLDNQRKGVIAAREALIARLDPDDDRAALVRGILDNRRVDLDALTQLLEDTPVYTDDITQLRRLAGLQLPTDEEIAEAFKALKVAERAHKDAAKTDAARATTLAGLLKQALAARDPSKLTDDCPVCGTADVLDDNWAANAGEQIAALESQAVAMTEANAALTAARSRVRRLSDLPEPVTKDAVVEHVGALRLRSDAASAELTSRGAAWQELAGRVKEWLAQAREVEAKAPHAEGAQGRREMAQERHRRAAGGAFRADLRAGDRQLARAAPGLERGPARDHFEEGRPRRAGGLRRARRGRRRQRARRDVPGRAAGPFRVASSCRGRRWTSRRSASR